jgi:hypothetical protein
VGLRVPRVTKNSIENARRMAGAVALALTILMEEMRAGSRLLGMNMMLRMHRRRILLGLLMI